MAIDHLKSKRFYIQIPHSSHRDHEWMVIAEEMNNDFVSLLAAVLESHVSSCVPCKWKAILFRISTPVHRHIFAYMQSYRTHFVIFCLNVFTFCWLFLINKMGTCISKMPCKLHIRRIGLWDDKFFIFPIVQVEGLGVICRSLGMAYPPINLQVQPQKTEMDAETEGKNTISCFRRKSHLFQWLQGLAAEETAQSIWKSIKHLH